MGVLNRLNPYAQTLRRREILAEQARKEEKAGKKTKKAALKPKNLKKAKNSSFVKSLLADE